LRYDATWRGKAWLGAARQGKARRGEVNKKRMIGERIEV
jgi:hypothetical protein